MAESSLELAPLIIYNGSIMSLTKQDLKDIQAVVSTAVRESEERTVGRIQETEERLTNLMDKKLTAQSAGFAQIINDFATHVDERLDAQDAKLNIITDAVDRMAGDYSTLKDEEAASSSVLVNYRTQLDDHEERIGHLEQASA
jgi:hypothetical protein